MQFGKQLNALYWEKSLKHICSVALCWNFFKQIPPSQTLNPSSMKLIKSLVLPTMSVCSVSDVTCTAHFFSQMVDCIAHLRHCPSNCVLRQLLSTVTMIFMETDNDVPAPLLCPLDCFVYLSGSDKAEKHTKCILRLLLLIYLQKHSSTINTQMHQNVCMPVDMKNFIVKCHNKFLGLIGTCMLTWIILIFLLVPNILRQNLFWKNMNTTTHWIFQCPIFHSHRLHWHQLWHQLVNLMYEGNQNFCHCYVHVSWVQLWRYVAPIIFTEITRQSVCW